MAKVLKSDLTKTIHFLTNFVGMILNPAIVCDFENNGVLIPDFALESIEFLSNDVKMHIDVKKAIISNCIGLVKYMEVNGISLIE